MALDAAEDGRLRSEYTASTAASSSASSSTRLVGDDVRPCGFCVNVKLLREVLPPKKCDYCHKLKCQFCTLKFPLLSVKKVLPKTMKGNTRICLHCFSERWQENGLTTTRGKSKRASARQILLPEPMDNQRESLYQDAVDAAGKQSFDEATFASMRNSLGGDSPDRSSLVSAVVPKPAITEALLTRFARLVGLTPATRDSVHVVDLWASLVFVAILFVIVFVDELPVQHRAGACAVTYAIFLALHPWVHRATNPAPTTRSLIDRTASLELTSPKLVPPVTELPRTVKQPEVTTPGKLPEMYRSHLKHMEDSLAFFMSDECPWKLVKTAHGGKVFETTTDKPQTLFMIEVFVPGISIAAFLSYLNRTDLKDRARWDWNVANFEIAETYPDDNVSVIYNAQKAFLGGFVSARDFCLLYTVKENCIVYSSVVHPKVPERANATRGTVHFAGFHCTPQRGPAGEDGFQLRYMVQVDIGGSIPTRLLYNGTLDNMEKMIKSFKQAKTLFK